MKFLIINFVMYLFFIQIAKANDCEGPTFKESNYCIIAGGGADTTKTINLAHARSLSLRNARILAYEKMAERLEGLILGSQSSLSNDLLRNGEVKTIVQATLKNVIIQKESVSFLSDGSPWAEVTLSAPMRGPLGLETKVLEYSNGTKKENNSSPLIVIDLRDHDYKKSHFFDINDGVKTILKFNNFVGNVPIFQNDQLNMEDQAIKIIKPLKIDQANITLNSEDSKYIVMQNYSQEIIKNKKLVFLTK